MEHRILVSLLLLAITSWPGPSRAADQYGFDVQVNVDDAKTLHLSASVPADTRHTLQVDGSLQLELQTRPRPPAEGGGHLSDVLLVDTAAAASGRRVLGRTTWVRGPGEVLKVAFSRCGDRAIVLQHEAASRPGRCADLLPLSPPDAVLGPCGDCAGAYEGMPRQVGNRSRIAPATEPGEPLRITGRVFGPDGKPRSGVTVYAYHTDRSGIYPPPDPPRAESHHQGLLRGWARTGRDGRYAFDTIRPGSYPRTTNPQHVHMHVIEPGCATYYIDEIVFTDDPMFQQLGPEARRFHERDVGGSGVVTPQRRRGVTEVTRDIHLGRNVPGYAGCAR